MDINENFDLEEIEMADPLVDGQYIDELEEIFVSVIEDLKQGEQGDDDGDDLI